MAEYNADGTEKKKKFGVKIAGFTLGKGFFIFVGIIVAIIAISTISEQMKLNAEIEAERLRLEAEAEAMKNQDNSVEEYDFHAEMQRSLTAQYGVAPEGFEWDYMGNLVAIGNDAEATAEDVLYMFIRALSILDFSTATKYSSGSSVLSSYQNYYSDYGMNDYYSNFLRKQFKKSLTSIEIDKITDTAVWADGTKYITISLNVLDLTDKDFWRDDEENLWKTMRVYRETEEDSVKLEQHVYDYIYEKYEDETIGKRTVTVELVVSKENGGGWLVTTDTELDAVLQYENGVDTARYILDAFNNWYQETTLKEQLEAVEKSMKMSESESESEEVAGE